MSVSGPNDRPSPGIAVLVTAAAVALVNVGLASLIVAAVGARTVAPPAWLAALLLALGLVAAAGAAALWRQYFRSLRRPD